MAYTYLEAVEQLKILLSDGKESVETLEKLIADTSAKIPQAGPDSIYLLYSGDTDDVKGVETATNISNNKKNALVIADTPVGMLLNNEDFKLAYFIAQRDEYRATIPGFAELSKNEQWEILKRANSLAFNGTDASGKRVTSDSLWDQASKRYVEEATGSFRILATNASEFSIFYQTELPALL